MVSPHPSTMQIVAEATRRERLQHLADVQRYPVRPSVVRRHTGGLLVWCGRRLLAAGVRLQMHADLRRRPARSYR